ncbi:hypothetical protein L4X63_19345 [Geomonas sp. Red32]|uniref:hypothetical protein n=1 Tax=Geomonas sp. Red32 TaxID=2912856 RepID=UPI00202CFB25|nr:hypothetical protein [Geomonas sp. Red32]MCM0083748.1 hypothetical protein [Geomonas sp. Red32]
MFRSILFSLLLLITLAGCGVDWFPDTTKTTSTTGSSSTVQPFSFTNATNVAFNTVQTSDPVTIAFSNGSTAAISVSNGQYSINSTTSFTSVTGKVHKNDQVRVQHTSASTAGGTVATTLTVGNQSATFSSTTTTASVSTFFFSPAGYAGVTTSGTTKTSNSITVNLTSGTSAPISITGGEYVSSSSGGFTSSPGTVQNGDQVVVQNISSNVAVTTVLTIGDQSATFSTTPGNVAPETVYLTGTAGGVITGSAVLALVPGTYTVHFVSSSTGSGGYALTAADVASGTYTGAGTDETHTFANGDSLYFSDLLPATAGQVATTIVNIDGVPITFKVTAQ